jgi:hypothetical protein
MLLDGKVRVYGLYCRVPEAELKGCKLTRADKVFIDYALKYSPLRKRLHFLKNVGKRPFLNLTEAQKFYTEVLTSEDLNSYTLRYVHKKMSFLGSGYGVTMQDLKCELIGWGLYSLQRAYPAFDDVGHGLQIAKTVIKRTGVNIMKARTAKRNNELITNEDGSCTKTTVSTANIQDGTGQFLTLDGTFIHRSLLVVGINGFNQEQESVPWETSVSIKQLCDSKMFTDKHRLFLDLMLGQHHDEFSEFLSVPNEDFIECAKYDVYKRQVCNYLNISECAANKFLSSLKSHLGEANV